MLVSLGAECWLAGTDCIKVQACCRALIVDTLPIPKQQTGSSWGKSARSGMIQLANNMKLVECVPWDIS